MESAFKDLPLPKEAQQMIQEVPALQELIEPEPQGIGWGVGIGIVVGVVAAGAILKFGCKKLKK
tara:strand:- start:1417 stop:1608 length:192 start_codon:yes stop_codon:yes gene_type:complete